MIAPDDRLKNVFDRAAEAPDLAARAALLDRECAGDTALRERVEALLRAHDAAGSFLDGALLPVPGGATGAGDQPDPPAANWVGPPLASGTLVGGRYKLLEEIGEGGMGAVWMAEQTEPVRRRVAVKLVKPGMDSKQVVARFEAERQALAMMDHPNIARVLDAGTTPDGRPFFVMELVKGTPITQYSEQKRLPLKDRLVLFAAVCRAVQHAHQKGVIHRDLKPSNVLVAPYDGHPVVKVIDFGVAKATGAALTDKTLFTGFGAVVGTPEYMSPEQAELNNADVDTRSDVYSLGVLLYELLTGTTPLTRERVKGAALLEVLRLVREVEPPKPSTRLSTTATGPQAAAAPAAELARLSQEIRGELDWIVMKALEKDRNRRYETASSLAADVERYLAGEPVQAVPPSAGYRLRRFVRRNRAAVAVGVFVALVGAAALGGIGWVARDRVARHARVGQEVDAAVRESEAAQAWARTLTDQPHGWDAALAEARSALARAEGFAAQDSAALDPRQRERLGAARAALEADEADRRFGARFDAIRLGHAEFDTEVSEFKVTEVLPTLTEVFRKCYGIELGATPIAETVAVIRQRPQPIRDLLSAALVYALSFTGVVQGPLAEWVAAVLDRVDDDPWRRRARAAAAARDWAGLEAMAGEPAAARQPAAVLVTLAARIPWEERAKDRFLRRVQFAHPGDFWANHELAIVLQYNVTPRLEEAARYHMAALALRPDNPAEWVNLGNALAGLNDRAGAEAAFRRALQIAPNYREARRKLDILLGKLDPWDSHIAVAREELARITRKPNSQNEKAHWLNELAWNLATAPDPAKRKPAEAVALAEQAVALHPTKSGYWNTLGAARYRAGDYLGAVAALERAMELGRGGGAHDWFLMALTLHRLGRADEARRWYDRAVAWCEANGPVDGDLRRLWAETTAVIGPATPPGLPTAPAPRLVPSGKSDR